MHIGAFHPDYIPVDASANHVYFGNRTGLAAQIKLSAAAGHQLVVCFTGWSGIPGNLIRKLLHCAHYNLVIFVPTAPDVRNGGFIGQLCLRAVGSNVHDHWYVGREKGRGLYTIVICAITAGEGAG